MARPFLRLSAAQETIIRRLGYTPGHVESCPTFADGRDRESWRRTVRALHRRGLIRVLMDHVLGEGFLQLTREGLCCAKRLYLRSEPTMADREAQHRLRQWRAQLREARALIDVAVPAAPHSAATRDGIARARRSGVRIGRPPAAIPVERVLALRASGTSLRAISKTVGVGAATVQRFLKRVDGSA